MCQQASKQIHDSEVKQKPPQDLSTYFLSEEWSLFGDSRILEKTNLMREESKDSPDQVKMSENCSNNELLDLSNFI